MKINRTATIVSFIMALSAMSSINAFADEYDPIGCFIDEQAELHRSEIMYSFEMPDEILDSAKKLLLEQTGSEHGFGDTDIFS